DRPAGEGRKRAPPWVRLPCRVEREVALLIHHRKQELLTQARDLMEEPGEGRRVEHRPLRNRSDPVLRRRLVRRPAARIHEEVGRPSALDHDITPLPKVAICNVLDLELVVSSRGGPKEGAHRQLRTVPYNGEPDRLD